MAESEEHIPTPENQQYEPSFEEIDPASHGTGGSDDKPPRRGGSKEFPRGSRSPRGKAEDAEKDKKTRTVAEQREARFFVREQFIDKESGDIFWLVSPTDKNDSEQVLKIRVANDSSVDKSGLIKALNAWNNDIASLGLLRRDGAENWEVWAVEPPPNPKERVVKRANPDPKKGMVALDAFEWTENLDDMVDRYHTYRSYEQVASAFSELVQSPNAVAAINNTAEDKFAKIVQETAQSSGITVTPQEISDQWAAMAGDRRSVEQLFSGQQVSPDGAAQKIYYDSDRKLNRQLDCKTLTKQSLFSAANNYCIQKAIAELATSRAILPIKNRAGDLVSPYEYDEGDLVSRKLLFAQNPLLDSDKMTLECRELAEMNSGKILRNMLSVGGAKPAVPEVDDIKFRGLDSISVTVQAEVRAYAETHDLIPTASEMKSDPGAQARYREGMLNASREVAKAQQEAILRGKNGILHEQDVNGAVKPPFNRVTNLGLSIDLVKHSQTVHDKMAERLTDAIDAIDSILPS